MDQESKGLLLKQIKEGGYLPDAMVDVHKVLANAGMELYAKLCCDRIEAAGLVDGVHVSHGSPTSWKLQVDSQGIGLCREILGAYLQPQNLDDMQKLLQSCQDYYTSLNNMLYSLRKMSVDDLKAVRMEKFAYKVSEQDIKDITDLYDAERKCRRIPSSVRRTGNRITFVYHMLRHFPGPVRILWPFIREAWSCWDTIGISDCTDDGQGKYSKALRRFTESHGGTRGIKNLQGDDLAKYIFLAVKAYGMDGIESLNRSRGPKSCLMIDRRYQDLKQVMEAIGRLTPEELLRMYPVEKKFNGTRWNEKDYFYTMDKLRCWPADQPLGGANDVACLLWDYQNWDLDEVLIEWMHVLGDLRIYCNDPAPDEEFHRKMEKARLSNGKK